MIALLLALVAQREELGLALASGSRQKVSFTSDPAVIDSFHPPRSLIEVQTQGVPLTTFAEVPVFVQETLTLAIQQGDMKRDATDTSAIVKALIAGVCEKPWFPKVSRGAPGWIDADISMTRMVGLPKIVTRKEGALREITFRWVCSASWGLS